MADTRLLHLRLLARLGGVLVELVPALLPVVHGVLGLQQGLGRGLFHRLQQLQLGGQGGELRLPATQPVAVLAQVALGFRQAGLGLAQVLAQLPPPLLLVLEGLLQPGHFRAQGVVAGLHLVEGVGALGVVHPVLLDCGIHLLVFRVHGLQLDLQFAYAVAGGPGLGVQRLPLQRLQLRLQGALLALELGILFRRLGLALQVLQLPSQLVAQVGQALQVFQGAPHAALGLLAALLVLGDAGGFLDKHPQVFRLGLDQAGDHALLDDGVTARTQARAQEDIGDIAAPAAGAIEEVFGLGLAGDQALDGNLGVAGVLAPHPTVAVVEYQFDGGLPHRLAVDRAVENHVGHGLAAQVLGGTLPHDPAHGVDDVRLAAAIGADDRAHIAGKIYRRGIDE